jgi:hypothetical protein
VTAPKPSDPALIAESVAMADAARRYVRGILKADVDDAAVRLRAARWSFDGWQAVARRAGLGFVDIRIQEDVLAILDGWDGTPETTQSDGPGGAAE